MNRQSIARLFVRTALCISTAVAGFACDVDPSTTDNEIFREVPAQEPGPLCEGPMVPPDLFTQLSDAQSEHVVEVFPGDIVLMGRWAARAGSDEILTELPPDEEAIVLSYGTQLIAHTEAGAVQSVVVGLTKDGSPIFDSVFADEEDQAEAFIGKLVPVILCGLAISSCQIDCGLAQADCLLTVDGTALEIACCMAHGAACSLQCQLTCGQGGSVNSDACDDYDQALSGQTESQLGVDVALPGGDHYRCDYSGSLLDEGGIALGTGTMTNCQAL